MDNTTPPSKPPRKKDLRSLIWYFIGGLTLLLLVSSLFSETAKSTQISFTEFLNLMNQGQVKEVTLNPNEQVLTALTTTDTQVKAFYVNYPNLLGELQEKNIKINVNPTNSNWFVSLFMQAFLPFLLIAGLWFFIFRQAQGANNQAMSFGKSRAKEQAKGEKPEKTFKDVAGADEALEELAEIVDFLKHPKRYNDIGARIPKGVLLMGPPGTGKTLLAKAVAGEADVPFFNISGSEFVEMFVGVGASRVRDLFSKAKKSQPCIIFVDEIDAVGRQRGAGLGGGHDEREQTLNQLLVEMDGFEKKANVIVIAATNRPDILDPALLRPGRFDRQITVGRPDIKGREAILAVHAKGKKLAKSVDLAIIAKRTPGFTGADLANLLNEGALLAARDNKKTVAMSHLEKATDRIMTGPERKAKVLTGKEKEIVAYHEVGHAIVAYLCKDADPVHKISILPTGRALGYTLQLPENDKHLHSRSEIKDHIRILLGGRIAEDLIFNEITSGASNDIERATEMARNYICTFGMSEKLGPRKYGKGNSEVFLGRDYSDHSKDYSNETAHEIDMEIKTLIQTCYDDAQTILRTHLDKLHSISKLIMEKEVISGKDFIELMTDTPPKKATKKDEKPV